LLNQLNEELLMYDFSKRHNIPVFSMVALLAALLILRAGIEPASATSLDDCFLDGQRQQEQCVRDSCFGVCTEAAWNRCVRIGNNRLQACVRFIDRTTERAPGTPGGPGPKRRPDFAPGLLGGGPDLSPTGPAATGSPGGVGRPPAGPVLR
jgi:hypothetical protein